MGRNLLPSFLLPPIPLQVLHHLQYLCHSLKVWKCQLLRSKVDDPQALPALTSSTLLLACQVESSVPVATWCALKVCNVLEKEREESFRLKWFGVAGIFACQRSNLAGIRNMHLLLKSLAHTNAVSAELVVEGRHVERDNSHTTGWIHFMSSLDLAYVDYVCSKPAHLIPPLLQLAPLPATRCRQDIRVIPSPPLRAGFSPQNMIV